MLQTFSESKINGQYKFDHKPTSYIDIGCRLFRKKVAGFYCDCKALDAVALALLASMTILLKPCFMLWARCERRLLMLNYGLYWS